MNITDTIRIQPNREYWQVVVLREGKNPKTKQRTVTERYTYHATLKQAAERAADMVAHQSPAPLDLRSLTAALERLAVAIERNAEGGAE